MKQKTLEGKTLSPGLAIGTAFIYRDVLKTPDEFYDIDEDQVDQEIRRFDGAVEHVAGLLTELAASVEKEMNDSMSGVFDAHSIILQDASLGNEVREKIRNELVSAASAVRAVFRRWERRFKAMDAEVSRQKADDMRDLSRRLIHSLAGIRSHALEKLPAGSVLVANRLLPSDTIVLGRKKAAGAILEKGGTGSHAALFAREIGLPCVAGLDGLVNKVAGDGTVLVDADRGVVVLDPDESTRSAYEKKRSAHTQAFSRAKKDAAKSAVTQDGTRIAVLANVGCPEDTANAVDNGAEGVGLYRTERLYLDKSRPPDCEALLEELRATLLPAAELPVYVRLLDAGADKPLPFMDTSREANPALGKRGIRYLFDAPELLSTQLKALLRLSTEFNLHIIVPMVTLPSEMERVRSLLAEEAEQLNITTLPKLGAMIETPAAALGAEAMSGPADFFSLGTNDLTQYVFATDRENPSVDHYFKDAHPAIFRLIRMVRQDLPDMDISVCGELAGYPEHVEKILRCGIRTLSTAPALIPRIKETIRNIRL
ncbi:phosphoenolpyruvate--protein phosphotransferase [Pontiella sp.]|uniref:phosphoenolpyruvate--protein phosphotransferase n=1 Tax=Pontiella sp. TaxID=2837462 RepID=UPI003564DB2C